MADPSSSNASTAPRPAGINEPCKLACADCGTYCDCVRAEPRSNEASCNLDALNACIECGARSTGLEPRCDAHHHGGDSDKATSAEEVRNAALQEAEDAIKAIRFENGIMGVGADYAANVINGLRSAPARDLDYPLVPLLEGLVLTNGGQRCDMAIGPCACGATHEARERRPWHTAWSDQRSANPRVK